MLGPPAVLAGVVHAGHVSAGTTPAIALFVAGVLLAVGLGCFVCGLPPAKAWIRVLLAVAYALAMGFALMMAGLWVACAHGNCL